MRKKLAILGCRGLPARHGGFETFAEKLAPYLVENGWEVSVYCQTDSDASLSYSIWNGVNLVNIPSQHNGPLGTVLFDWQSVVHAGNIKNQLILTLGYNTAIFSIFYKLKKCTNIINMDGIEWQRGKWSYPVRAWFYLNEKIASLIADHLIADHPGIKQHLSKWPVKAEKITMIAYGADKILSPDATKLEKFGLLPNQFALIVGRPQKDNTVLEMVSAFSKTSRKIKLAVLCPYDPQHNTYDKQVMDTASDEVIFLGPVYDDQDIQALQFYCRIYLHGHQVGGTNPSLVEALGAGSAIIAHDNIFNRWVADSAAAYFSNQNDCEQAIENLLNNEALIKELKRNSLNQRSQKFTWEKILEEYNQLLTSKYEVFRVNA